MSEKIQGIRPKPIAAGKKPLEEQLVLAVELIDKHKTFVVACHHGPDGDGIGSALALANILEDRGKEVFVFNRDGVPYNFRFLPGSDRVQTELSSLPSEPDVLAILDCSELKRVDPELSADRSKTSILCVDHHMTSDPDFADVFVHDEQASATGELVYRLLVALEMKLTREVATSLYTAIHTDTGSFRYANSTSASLAVSSELVRAGIDVWGISSQVYENHPEGRVRLLSLVLPTLRLSANGRLAFLTVSQEMYRATGTGPDVIDGFINFARGITGVEVACQLRETGPEDYRVSFRSRGSVNVAALAARFEGGGHRNAAGCRMVGTADQIIDSLTAELLSILSAEA